MAKKAQGHTRKNVEAKNPFAPLSIEARTITKTMLDPSVPKQCAQCGKAGTGKRGTTGLKLFVRRYAWATCMEHQPCCSETCYLALMQEGGTPHGHTAAAIDAT